MMSNLRGIGDKYQLTISQNSHISFAASRLSRILVNFEISPTLLFTYDDYLTLGKSFVIPYFRLFSVFASKKLLIFII